MPQTKLHTAARKLKAVTAALLRPAEFLQKKLKCCAKGSASADTNDAEVVSTLQPTAEAATATAVAHIFPKPACLKVLPQRTQISPGKTALSKLSGLWSCSTDPTRFDGGADKLKAQRRAARLSRARKRSSFAGTIRASAVFLMSTHIPSHFSLSCIPLHSQFLAHKPS